MGLLQTVVATHKMGTMLLWVGHVCKGYKCSLVAIWTEGFVNKKEAHMF